MSEISEEEMVEAIKFAHEAIKVQCAAQVKLAEAFGKKEVREYEPEAEDADLEKKIHDMAYDKVYEVAKAGSSKKERSEAFAPRKNWKRLVIWFPNITIKPKKKPLETLL